MQGGASAAGKRRLAASARSLLLAALAFGRIAPERGIAVGAPPSLRRDPLAPLEFLIGRWVEPQPDPRIRGRPGLDERVAMELEWGPGRRAVLLHESYASGRRDGAATVGLLVWHPLENAIVFTSVDTRSGALLQGTYTPLRGGRLERVYTVYYPDELADIPEPSLEGRVRRFRERYVPIERDRLRVELEIWKHGAWQPWPREEGATHLLRLR